MKPDLTFDEQIPFNDFIQNQLSPEKCRSSYSIIDDFLETTSKVDLEYPNWISAKFQPNPFNFNGLSDSGNLPNLSFSNLLSKWSLPQNTSHSQKSFATDKELKYETVIDFSLLLSKLPIFQTNINNFEHLLNSLNPPKKYICSACHKEFSNNKSLGGHVSKLHSNKKTSPNQKIGKKSKPYKRF